MADIDAIAQACGDPGSFVERGDGESVSRWCARAVVVALAGDDTVRADREPLPGEIWEEAGGRLLLRHSGGIRRNERNEVISQYADYWASFGREFVPDDDEVIERPMRLRFDREGHDVGGGEPLRYPEEYLEIRRRTDG